MTNLKVGELIGIPCSVQDGPFEREVLVEFESLDGTISGFTSAINIQEQGGQHFIKGRILAIKGTVIQAMVEGSFFTTNGLANFSSDKAELMPLAA